jgi:hypothetical protein
MMSTLELRRRIKKQVDALQPDRLPVAAKLLSDLRREKSPVRNGAKLTHFRARLAKAERDIAAGRSVPIEKLRRIRRSLAAARPAREMDTESIALANNPEFVAIIQRSRQRHEAEGGISIDEVRLQLGIRRRIKKTGKKRS